MSGAVLTGWGNVALRRRALWLIMDRGLTEDYKGLGAVELKQKFCRKFGEPTGMTTSCWEWLADQLEET